MTQAKKINKVELKEGFLEERLAERFALSADQLNQARKLNLRNHLGLLTNLQRLGALSEDKMVAVQEECFHTKAIHIRETALSSEVVNQIPEEMRVDQQIIPLSATENMLTVAIGSLFQGQYVSQALEKYTEHFVNFVLVYPSEIRERLQEFSKTPQNIDNLLEARAKELSTTADLNDQKLIEDPHGPVAQVISYLINSAVTNGASDIHLEPSAANYRIRFRQDGLLREIRTFEKVFAPPFSAAIKIMSNMDIAETRMPQDGTFRIPHAGRIVDFRVATYPTEHGEKIVIRILDANKSGISLDFLLLPPAERAKLIKVIEKPYGLIVCAGPTGSGKSTSLYAMLSHLNSAQRNILTIEDPIEYRMAGISQAQVNTKKGFSFAAGLRAMLRLDPNVILVGEMRDLETAAIGVQAALTGHMVLSTVHANSATETIARFMDLGVESFTVAAALQAVVSQRLVRKICDDCRIEVKPTPQEMRDAGFTEPYPEVVYIGKGCAKCRQEGYKGRVPVMEILIIYDDMRNMIKDGASTLEIFKAANERGMMTIRQNAQEKIKAGMTTIAELIRVVGPVGKIEAATTKAIATPIPIKKAT